MKWLITVFIIFFGIWYTPWAPQANYCGDTLYFFLPWEIQENGKQRARCQYFRGACFISGHMTRQWLYFYLSTKIISALFSHLETMNKQQSQVSVLGRRSGPSVTGSSETPGVPNRRQPNFISELIFMLFCIFAFWWSDWNIDYVASIILSLTEWVFKEVNEMGSRALTEMV